MTLPIISNEQLHIINEMDNKNVLIDSVAGSGKTTTNLYIAKKFNNKKILLLTYNKKLRHETKERALQLNINNLEIHTYHSFGVKYYNSECMRDTGILNVIRTNIKSRSKINYNIIILDEAQDITPTYYEYICKIIKDNIDIAQICILGDKFQSIYQFNRADERYIIYGDKLFNFNDLLWAHLKLSYSFRVTSEIASFLNNCILKENRIISNKKGVMPRYIICRSFGDGPFKEIMYYLKMGYANDDIFVLAPSVRIKNSMTPVRTLANMLSDMNIPIYVPGSDDEKLDDLDILNGKIVFSTFHQTKGLERKVVIIFNFDDSYFAYFKKDNNVFICPNEIYVAITRAQEHLSVIHDNKNNYLQFIDTYKLQKYCTIKIYDKLCFSIDKSKNNKIDNISVTDMTRHLSSDVIMELLKFIDIVKINNSGRHINIETKTKQENLYENVSDITGTAISAYFQYINTGFMTIYDTLREHFDDIKFKAINLTQMTTVDLLYLANKYNSFVSDFAFKLKQVQLYDWLIKKDLDDACDRLHKYISPNSKFEEKYGTCNANELLNKKLIGRIDCVDEINKNIWEFKCVNEIDDTHKLQLAIYMYLFYTDYENKRQYNLNKLNEKVQELLNNIPIIMENDIITFDNNYMYTCEIVSDITNMNGKITKIYKNGNINVKTNIGVIKITQYAIINNYSYDDRIKQHEINNKKIIENINLQQNNNMNDYKFYLFNILNEEIFEIKSDINRLTNMIKYLIFNKYGNPKNMDDSEFMNKNKIIYDKYFNFNNQTICIKSKSKLIPKNNIFEQFELHD